MYDTIRWTIPYEPWFHTLWNVNILWTFMVCRRFSNRAYEPVYFSVYFRWFSIRTQPETIENSGFMATDTESLWLRLEGFRRNPEALFSCQNGGIPTISRHTAQTENVRKCTPMSTFPVPSKVPELSTQQDMLTTALQIRHSVRASHEQGSSVFLIITPVHAHRHVQRLRRHIRRNPRRNAPIRRNIRPRTLQTTPSLTN